GRTMALTAALLNAIGAAIGTDSIATAQDAIFVSNYGGYVTIYALGSRGDVEPIGTIDGAATRMDGPTGIAVDSSGRIYVLNEGEGARKGGSVVVFAPGSNGNVAPIATISGSNTGIRSPKAIALDYRGNIYVANEEGVPPGPNIERPGGVSVYPARSNGDVKPTASIRGADVNMNLCCPCTDTCCGNDTGIQNPYGIAVDSRSNLYVTSTSGCPRSQGESVRVFAAGSDGNVKPSAIISGPHTGLTAPNDVALDSKGDIYVTDYRGRARDGKTIVYKRGSIIVYRPGSSGDAAPMARIAGPKTGIDWPGKITVDSKDRIYVSNATVGGQNGTESIEVFDPGSNGDVAPRAIIVGDSTGLNGIAGMSIGPYRASR
ncbi:MAG: hypothetical protein WA571_08715, partial [Candidatus Binatus sp.]